MRIAIYTRKSRLSETGDSIKNQIQLCEEYIKNNICGDNDIKIYRDEGFSGKNKDRPAYNKLMLDIKNNIIDAVLVYKLDRISRNVLDFSETLEILNFYNIAFISVTEHFDTSTPMGRAMIYISSVFAQLERETIGERIRDNKYKLARTGQWLGGPAPYGYNIEQIKYDSPSGNKKHYSILVQDRDKIEIVKEIYDTYLKTKSLNSVANYLAKKNIRTNRGVYFTERAIKIILSNPIYVMADKSILDYFSDLGCIIECDTSEFSSKLGLTIFNKYKHTKSSSHIKPYDQWIIAFSHSAGIIDSSCWLSVQALLNRDKLNLSRAGSSNVSLLSSFIICAKCGKKMNVNHKISSSGNKHFYYRCRTKSSSKGFLCNMQNLNGIVCDKSVLDLIQKYICFDYALIKEILLSQEKTFSNQSNALDKLREENRMLKSQVTNLTLQLSKDISISSYIIEQIKLIDTQIKSNEYKISQLISTEKKYIDKPIHYGLDDITTLTFSEKKQFLKNILKAIYWDGNEISLELLY